MKLKTVTVGDKTYAEVLDGKPLFLGDDGKEIAVDVPHTTATISRLNSEAKGHRERAETAEKALKVFEGIEDAEAAKKAIETVANLETGKLLTAGKVDELKAGMGKAFEEKYAASIKTHTDELARTKGELEKKTSELNSVMIGGGFSRSKLITDPKHPMALVIPADIAEARFGKNFKVEEGKIVAYDNNNNKIFSRAKPGDLADFDEALETLVDQYPYKDQIIRGSGNKGDGARGSNGAGGSGGQKTITRTEFDKLDPAAQAKAAIGKDAMQIVD